MVDFQLRGDQKLLLQAQLKIKYNGVPQSFL